MKKQTSKKDRAGLYRIKAGPEVVHKDAQPDFVDKKKKAAMRPCRAWDKDSGAENWPGEGI